MKVFIVLALVAVAAAQYADPNAVPIPYSFGYTSATEDGGSSGHQESGDGAGRVTGSYTVQDLEGHVRTVEYVADEAGFRATIRTNEPGTANQNPADVIMESSAPESAGAPVYSLGGGGAAPQPAAAARGQGVRYVLVPSTDPRARGYY
ncbi:cuticle protein 10.9-like [Uloborus diversus]|uniref:cuticle protein 10.9-like n=1 Tax=Uloborus diversus TaxID=327109 RepID=UPI00240935D1|nr:cuticle protein 10.9-like [Uloborus diversus]